MPSVNVNVESNSKLKREFGNYEEKNIDSCGAIVNNVSIIDDKYLLAYLKQETNINQLRKVYGI
jgi:hypothetical protein